jgi:LmbE family N-acetylglucosaminyl deacetylase
MPLSLPRFRRLRPPAALRPDERPAISAVVPAYNEAGRIGRVLAVLRQMPELSEIIVVDDGSPDATWAEIQQAAALDARVRGVQHPVNRGKGAALFTGAREAQSEVLLLLDADLMNLAPRHVYALIDPVCRGEADMTLGLFCSWHLNTTLAHWITPWLSGQRCLSREKFLQLSEQNASGYGVETALSLTARRLGWRCRHVFWTGVFHPPSETHRGGWRGVRNRARMYAEIFKTWRAERGWQLIGRKLWLLLLAAVLTLSLVGTNSFYNTSQAAGTLRLADLPVWRLADAHRLLVVAPHPDDETLGAGGALQAALAAHAQVKVVIVTNGDGQLLAPLALRGKMLARPADYVVDGQMRQKESLAALQALGVPDADVVFLGYPDGGLNRLWRDDWVANCPMRSVLTRAQHSPYPRTFHPEAVYCGKEVLEDLQTIVTDFKPDMILLPHPNDDNADHRAVSNFSQMAVALAEQANPAYQPEMWGYLVHYGYYPQPRRPRSTLPLLPPVSLSYDTWSRLDLSTAQVQTKASALGAYTSQMRLWWMQSFLRSFARPNEIFARIDLLDVAALAYNTLPDSLGKVMNWPRLPEPAEANTRQWMLGSADLVGVRVGRLGDYLWLTGETRSRLFSGLSYRITIKLPDGQTRIVTWPGAAIRSGPNRLTALLNLEELGRPALVGFAAEVRQGATLDWTGWHFVRLRDTLP